jgi:hypothetical protein
MEMTFFLSVDFFANIENVQSVVQWFDSFTALTIKK